MTVKKAMIIVNPAAGMGRGRRFLPEVYEWEKRIALQKGIRVSVELTSKAGENNATNLARRAVEEGYDLIIVVGGDGTINEIANGIVGTKIPIAIVPVGNGNDIARALGIPKKIEKALNVAIEGSVFPIDLGKVNNRYFVNFFGVGFDAKIAKRAEGLKTNRRFLPNILLYFFALLHELRFKLEYPLVGIETLKMDRLRITSDNITLLVVANGPTCGAIFRLAPDAKLSDGFFDICQIGRMKRLRIFWFLPRAMRGTHISLREVKKDDNGRLPRVSRIKISSLENKIITCQMDGEVLPAERRYTVSIVPKALNVVIPQLVEHCEERAPKKSRFKNVRVLVPLFVEHG